MPRVIEFLLLNRAGDRSADGFSFQHLKGGDLIDADNPHALFGQACRIPIAPQDLLRSLLEPDIQACRLPVTGAVRLQIDIMQDVSHSACADPSHNSIGHGSSRQVIARPMCDMQPLRHRFQAGKFYDLSPLHRSDLQISSRVALPLIREQAPPSPSVDSVGRYARSSIRDSPIRTPGSRAAGLPPFQESCAHDELGTKARYRCEQPAPIPICRDRGWSAQLVCVHAWASSQVCRETMPSSDSTY